MQEETHFSTQLSNVGIEESYLVCLKMDGREIRITISHFWMFSVISSTCVLLVLANLPIIHKSGYR